MIIEGRELVTKATQFAARQLALVSSIVLGIVIYDIPLTDLSLLGLGIRRELEGGIRRRN